MSFAYVSFAQTEQAKAMFAEATSGKLTTSQYLKRDFAKVDSTSMHDLAVLFYRANDFVSAGTCWEIALSKVQKHGKAGFNVSKIVECNMMEKEEKEIPVSGNSFTFLLKPGEVKTFKIYR